MGCDTVVDIRSPKAEDYPFHLGDRVRSTLGGGDEGVIKTGVYYGAASEGAYRTFYVPKSAKMENIRRLIGEPDKMYKLFGGYSLHRTP